MDSNQEKKQMMESNRDMISALASSLLVLIISFLPFKEAVRTSILSRQWRCIWRHTTNIELDENFFVNREAPEPVQTAERGAFLQFAQSFVANYSQRTIRKFKLVLTNPKNSLRDVQYFIAFAISHDAKDLALDFSHPFWRERDRVNRDALFELPSSAYERFGAGLESLTLFSCSLDGTRIGNFPMLKDLSLGWIKFDAESIKRLFRSCPMLESFSMKRCWNIEAFEVYHDSKPDLRLKSLVLDNCDFKHYIFSFLGAKLRYFKYAGRVCIFQMECQSELVEADLDFGMQTEYEEGPFLYDLVQEFYRVQKLTVCGVLLQIIPSGEESLRIQDPLQVSNLIVKTAMQDNEMCGLKFMLESCPQLHALTIELTPTVIFPDYDPPYQFTSEGLWTGKLPEEVERCVRVKLRVVNVIGFRGTWNEWYLLRYILHYGSVLQQLNVYVTNDDLGAHIVAAIRGIAQQLLTLHRASPNAVVSII